MRAWYAGLSKSFANLPSPTGAPEAHASGNDPDRVLLFGNGPVLGYGVSDHDLALPGHLARELSRRTDRGADVHADSVPVPSIADAPALLRGARLDVYDAIIVIVGISDACRLMSPGEWEAHMGAVLTSVVQGASSGTAILVCGMQPVSSIPIFRSAMGTLATRHSRQLNEVTQRVVPKFPAVSYLELPAPQSGSPGRHRSSSNYLDWASVMAETVAPAMDRELIEHTAQASELLTARELRNQPENERARQRALDGMHLVDAERNATLERIVAFARSSFGTSSAAVTLIDRNEQRFAAQVGSDNVTVKRAEAFCDHTIRQSNPMIIGDALLDERFADNPLVTGDAGVRFYAGFPIESPDGYRIGALCVFDQHPRAVETVSASVLRDVALMVQRELAKQCESAGKRALSTSWLKALGERRMVPEGRQNSAPLTSPDDAGESRILAATAYLLSMDRPDEISLPEVARIAGVPVGSIEARFGGVQDLVAAARVQQTVRN